MDAEQDGDQHRRAEHGENMLDAQGNKLCRRDLFIYLNDALFVHGIPLLSKYFS